MVLGFSSWFWFLVSVFGFGSWFYFLVLGSSLTFSPSSKTKLDCYIKAFSLVLTTGTGICKVVMNDQLTPYFVGCNSLPKLTLRHNSGF